MSRLPPHNQQVSTRRAERGNVLFMILLAVVLIGLLTVAIQSTNRPEGSNIDKETLAIRATEAQRYASELERAVNFVLGQGVSEEDIRFAHYDAHADYGDITSADGTYGFRNQIFHVDGGAAEYRDAPNGVNDGSAWEFYGGTHIPGVGTSAADLVAVLPNVTDEFCAKINELNGQTGTPADTGATNPAGDDAGDCIHGQNGANNLVRFDAGQKFYATGAKTNSMDETTFEQDANTGAARPAPQACVVCSIGPANHFYHVLHAR